MHSSQAGQLQLLSCRLAGPVQAMGHRERERNHCVLLINKVIVELAVVCKSVKLQAYQSNKVKK